MTWPAIVLLLLGPPNGETVPAPPTLPPAASGNAPAAAPAATTAPATSPAPVPAAPPILPTASGSHAKIQPADASARPGQHTREWKPTGDLVRVPFPLERTRPSASDQRFRAPIVDLRDPFVHGRPGRPLPAELRRNLLPDLKDPFILPRHPRPRGWKITLPGDIRDPFVERNIRFRVDCNGKAESTRDGVTIQRPGQSGVKDAGQGVAKSKSGKRADQGECRRITRPLPADLLDPFRRRKK